MRLARVGIALALSLGCGGPALTEQAYRDAEGREHPGQVYRDGEASYRVGTLEGRWQRLGVAGQNDLAWHSEELGAIVQVNATCDPDSDVPLPALTNHLLIGFTARELREQELVPMDGREALRTHVVARLDGVLRELLLYVLKKDDCVYDLALIAPPGTAFERARPVFQGLVDGFTTVLR